MQAGSTLHDVAPEARTKCTPQYKQQPLDQLQQPPESLDACSLPSNPGSTIQGPLDTAQAPSLPGDTSCVVVKWTHLVAFVHTATTSLRVGSSVEGFWRAPTQMHTSAMQLRPLLPTLQTAMHVSYQHETYHTISSAGRAAMKP